LVILLVAVVVVRFEYFWVYAKKVTQFFLFNAVFLTSFSTFSSLSEMLLKSYPTKKIELLFFDHVGFAL
jgi:hypothetical protein